MSTPDAPTRVSQRDAARRRWGLGPHLGLGISLGGVANSDEWRATLDWVEHAESLGLHSLWLPEMHFAPGASSSPLVALSAYAAHSRTLRLATTSLLLPIHSPRQLARDIAQLDRLSRGRAIIGLGRGFRAPLFSAFGIDPASKRDRFDDALDAILASWSSEGASGIATHQTPHPPLAVAAFGPKGLRQAARRALPYLPSPMETLEQLSENREIHHENLPEGVDPDSLVVPVMRIAHVAASDEEAARVRDGLEAERRAISRHVPRAIARAAAGAPQDRVLVGMAPEVEDGIARYREALGMDLLVARAQVAGASHSERLDSLVQLREIVDSSRL